MKDTHTRRLYCQTDKVLVASREYVLSNVKNSVRSYDFHPVASAELYDPDTGLWELTRTLNQARSSHTATLLANGKVLVAAGSEYFDIYYQYYSYTILNSAELYDPANGTWTDDRFIE